MFTVEIIHLIRPFVHYGLHFIFPILFAWLFFRKEFVKTTLFLIGTMLVDLDHLLANPIFDPNRCSINFHLFHQYWAILVYCVLLLHPKTRIIGLGLVFHMLTDTLDCWMMSY